LRFGHPVVAEPLATQTEIADFRAAHGLGASPVLLALPGSRRGEVRRLAPVFGAALQPVLARRPDLRVVVPAATAVAPLVREAVADWPGSPLVLDPGTGDAATAVVHKRAAFGTATVALAASGTVSLELAAADTPMVVAYRLNWLTMQIARRLVRIDTVTLVNLVSETRCVPECLGPECTPDRIAAALLGVMDDPGAQSGAMSLTMDRLGRGGEAPGLRAARAVLSRLP
jgi:lipid-A-disaccharide synthase